MQPLPPDLDSPATLHGLSAFTTIRTRHGLPLLLPEHLARLSATCTFLGLPAPDAGLPALEPLAWGLLRLTVTPGGTFWTHRPLPALQLPSPGVTAWLGSLQVHPQLGRHKTGNYLPYRLARLEAQAQDAFEGLLRDGEGQVVDGGRSGLLLRSGGRWTLPQGGLPSITRAAWLAGLGVTASVSPLAPQALRQASHLWLCGAGVGIVPVGMVRGDGWEQRYSVQWPETRHPALVVPGRGSC